MCDMTYSYMRHDSNRVTGHVLKKIQLAMSHTCHACRRLIYVSMLSLPCHTLGCAFANINLATRQHTATHCNTLQHTKKSSIRHDTHMSNLATLQHTATHKKNLQFVITHTCEWVMSHIWMCVTHIGGSCMCNCPICHVTNTCHECRRLLYV